MARYKMPYSVIVDTTKASLVWHEDTRWDGSNNISVATGSQWEHQTLYRSAKGHFYLECSSNWQGSLSTAAWIQPQEAAVWLVLNNHATPADIAIYAEDIEE